MPELTYEIADRFVRNFGASTDDSWLLDQTQRHGFSTMGNMYKACQRFLKTHKPAPAKKQKLHIEVVKFMGKNGGFAASDSTMYKTEIVGVNGERQNINDWQNEGYGYLVPKYANDDAAKWSALLGCPVVFVDTTTAPATVVEPKGKVAHEFTVEKAKDTIQCFKNLSNPRHIEYGDGYALAALERRARYYGFKTTEELKTAATKLVK